ncbi:hypothetical protein [Parasphingorhabdus sp.]|uniref:hypothetical protein n=2 Tax=Parasphingorhabdus sp. TaxID=2709688 RepID=UPI0032631DDA
MRRIFCSLVPAALALASAPANASGMPESTLQIADSDEAGDVAAPKLLPVAEFWQLMQSTMAEELQEVRQLIETEFRATLVPTGEAETDWNSRGLDLHKHIESLPGGIANNALLTLGEVPSLEFFGRVPADLLADWELIQAGSKAVSPLEAKGGVFVAIGPNHVVFEADDGIQNGNARCMKSPVERASDHVTVYRYSATPFDPDSDASLEAEAEAIVIYSMMGSLSAPPICSIFRRDQEGLLQSLTYTPDGRPLGLMNDDGDRLEIVSEVNLYEQLNANYTSMLTDDESSGPAEAARDPL